MKEYKIAMIGLGYVGLPLAVEFGKIVTVVGFDINPERIKELESGVDNTLEVESDNLKSAKLLSFSSNLDDIKECNYYIITVPTPTDKHKRPDFTPLYKASEIVGKVLSKGDVVVYESTVYPGATEEQCLPVVEATSGLKFNVDFFAGFSPERINPGDKERTVTKIVKVTSGSTPEIAEEIDQLYKKVITAGTHKATSIKVAEASKVIENTQRDINIAFINELAKIFNLLDINTYDVLEAAGTKWNFLKFKPGLVGGHCIGVDPYYLTHKAQEVGYHPEIIFAARRLNDNMGKYVASEIIKMMIKKGLKIDGAKVLNLGITFKENCPDIRNTRVIDVVEEMKSFGCDVSVHDPWANKDEIKQEYGLILTDEIQFELYDVVVVSVAHNEFLTMSFNKAKVLYDITHMVDPQFVDASL